MIPVMRHVPSKGSMKVEARLCEPRRFSYVETSPHVAEIVMNVSEEGLRNLEDW